MSNQVARHTSISAEMDGVGRDPTILVKTLALTLPTAAAFGAHLPGVGPLFGFRLLILLVAAIALATPLSNASKGLRQLVLAVAFAWTLIGVLLTFIAFDGTAAFRTMTGVSLGLILAVACLRIQAAYPMFINWLCRGWIASFLITSVIAIWEIRTGQHLGGYFANVDGLNSSMPAATFYNPNAYAIYLVGVQAVLMRSLSLSNRFAARILLVFSTLLNIALTATTGSRLGLAAVLLVIVAYLALDRFGLWRTITSAALIGALAWQFMPGAIDFAYEFLPEDVKTTSISQSIQDLSEGDTSGGRRVELYKASAWLTLHTAGMGVGPGNFGAAMLNLKPPYATGDTIAPHSFVGEVSAEFGVAVLALVGALLWSVMRRASRSKGPERSAIIATGIAFVPAGLANSSYLVSSAMWALFATVLCWTALAESESK